MRLFWLSLVVCFFIADIAVGATVASDVYGGNINWDTDFVVQENIYFVPDSVIIQNSVRVENRGMFHSDIVVCDGCSLYVKNSGDFVANVQLGNNAQVIAVVAEQGDISSLDIDSEYSVLVSGADGIRLADVVENFSGAKRIVLQNSLLDITGVNVGADVQLELDGSVRLYADDFTEFYGGSIFENVLGSGTVSLVDKTLDSMFVDVGFVQDGVLKVRRERETDYVRVLGNDKRGKLLNQLRINKADDALLAALDLAQDRSALENIMQRSVRFNPGVLASVGRMLNMGFVPNHSVPDKFYAGALGLFADDFAGYGMELGVGYNFDSMLKIDGRVCTGELKYSSEIDSFRGLFYGLGVAAEYQLSEENFISVNFQGIKIKTDISEVLYDNKFISNPDVLSGVATFDYGWNFNFSDSLFIRPQVGIAANLDKVADETDFQWTGCVGAEFGYGFELLGVRYDYGVLTKFGTENQYSVLGYMSVWSEFDMAGGQISIGALQTGNVRAWQLSTGVNIGF